MVEYVKKYVVNKYKVNNNKNVSYFLMNRVPPSYNYS